jgi:hypothetical protein
MPTYANSLNHFCNAIILALKSEYLRLPNCDELKVIEAQYSAMGFPECIGCVDVDSWYWNSCLVGCQGQYRGKEGKSCCRLEVVCDDSLYIWLLNFGTPGSRNDITQRDKDRVVASSSNVCEDRLPGLNLVLLSVAWHISIFSHFFAFVYQPKKTETKSIGQNSKECAKGCRVFFWSSM